MEFVYPQSSSASRRRVLMRRILVMLTIGAFFIIAISPQAYCQTLPKLSASPRTEQAPKDTDPFDTSSIDDLVGSCEQELQRARDDLERVRRSEQEGTARQLGASDEEIAERTMLLQDIVVSLEQRLKVLRRIKTIRQNVEALARERSAWDGFKDTAAVTIDFVDSLRDTMEIRRQDLRAAKAESALADKKIPALRAAQSDAERDLLKQKETLARNTDPAQKPILEWRQELASIRVYKATVELDQALAEQHAAKEAEQFHSQAIEFLQTQLQVANQLAPISSETLQAKLESLAAMRAQTEKELERARKAQTTAATALEEVRAKLAALQNAGESDEVRAQQALLKPLEEEREALAETARTRVDVHELVLTLIGMQETLWKQRFDMRMALMGDVGKRADALDRAKNLIEATRGKLTQPRLDLEANAYRTRALISAAEERLSLLADDSPERGQVSRMLESYYERGEICRLGLQRIGDVDRLLDRWENENEQYASSRSWLERVYAAARDVRLWGGRIWGLELLRVGDTVISIDKVLTVLVIVLVGVFVSRRIALRIRRLALAKLRIEESVAVPIEVGMFYTLIMLTVLFALSVVHIPLTVFAYLGGALAIGVGFGAQNLIGNFISGIIMLLERPIKIGDIVEVDGVFGIVRKIGARCSHLRRFDGIDMLVPNSSFLEKNVVNWTLSDRKVRFSISVGVAYGSPTRDVERLILQAAQEHPRVLTEPAPVVVFENFADNALVFVCYFWIELIREVDSRIVCSDLRHRVGELLQAANITIAFPQRDVHLDVQHPVRVALVQAEEGHTANRGTSEETPSR